MSIEFKDFSDLEYVAMQLDDTLNLLSILGENVFDDEFILSPYKAQFVSVNNAAINEIRKNKKEYRMFLTFCMQNFSKKKAQKPLINSVLLRLCYQTRQ